MKKVLKCIFCASFVIALFCVGTKVSAEETGAIPTAVSEGADVTVASSDAEYLITQSEDELTLSRYIDGTPERQESSQSLSELLALCAGGRVTLDEISVTGTLELPIGEYTLCGSLTVDSPIVIFEGTSVRFDSLELKTASYIRVKGGELTVSEGSISAGALGAVTVDYSSASRFTLLSGSISSVGQAPTVCIKSGIADIFGGSITNGAGAAIESSSTLTLSGTPVIDGAPYDIKTDEPISLSVDGVPYSGEATLSWQGLFDDGNMYEIFRRASAESISGITVFDSVGREYGVTYFDTCKHTDEVSFGAVYLPYEVTFFDGQESLFSDYYLYGELPKLKNPAEKTGYTFDGWYSDENLTNDFTFGEPISADTEIFASYKLEKPSFKLFSLSFTYDTEARLFGLDMLSHPLDEGGFYTLEWFKGEERVGAVDRINIKNVSDSGEYYCKITFNYGKDSVQVVTPAVSVAVLRQSVPLPDAGKKPYNGRLQHSDIMPNALYTVSDDGGVNVGEYEVLLTLRDSENYIFSDGSEGSATVIFGIIKCDNSWTGLPSVKDFYQNQPSEHTAYSAYGEPYFLYSDSENGAYTRSIPTLPGRYYCVAKVDGAENYNELVSEKYTFSIFAEIPLGITVNTPPNKTSYRAFEKFSSAGLSVTVTYNSGRTELVGADSLGIKYQSADSLLYGDNAVAVSYLSFELAIPVTVEKREYDISSLVFKDSEIIYDGRYHTLEYSGELPVGLDGLPLGVKLSSGGSDVGEYTVTLSFFTNSRNYILPENKTAILKITPRDTEIIWGKTDFIYDGEPKLPEAYFINALGVKTPLSVSGATVNARDGAIATADTSDKNYRFINPTVAFSVGKADISFSGVKWSADSFSYDGTAHTVSVSGLPPCVKVIGYTDNSFTDAGSYTATALLSYDERNYNAPAPLTHSWQITKAAYDTSTFSFIDSSFVYDGEAHSPTLVGFMPTGLDGSTLRYSFSALPTDVTDGYVTVRIVFSTESKNYLTPDETRARVEITPMPISVEWSFAGAVFDGTAHIPTAYSEYTEITVSGAMINAGMHTASASAVSKNYTVTNPTFAFEIRKAENAWLTAPDISDIFASGAPAPTANPLNGEAAFRYYTDLACTSEAKLPLTAGIYYMQAFVKESENYLGLYSEPIPFEVIAVVPTALEAELLTERFFAFDSLTDDIIAAFAVYNDSSRVRLSTGELGILYQSADAFRAGDTAVTVKYLSFEKTLAVEVLKAELPLDGIRWQGVSHIYDGTDKIPTLTGLPDGVTVKEYIGYGKNAGTYTVTAILSYDKANYNAPTPPSVTVTVAKSILDVPRIPAVSYDGSLHFPDFDKGLFKADFSGARDAGEYPFTLALNDSANYAFEGGADRAEATLTVDPATVAVSVTAEPIYLWQSPSMPDVRILGGTVSAEELMLYFELSGDEMIIKSKNPNYKIEGGVITLERVGRPSPEVLSAILISLSALVIVALAGMAVYLNREKIKDAIAVRRCKQSFAREEEIRRIDEITSRGDEGADTVFSVDVERADSLISDSLAKNLIKKDRETVYTDGKRKYAINIDTVSDNFSHGECVDINALKDKGLVPGDTAHIKILARGSIDKPLSVKANAFSLSAVKMIALSGGEAIKVNTQPTPKAKRAE